VGVIMMMVFHMGCLGLGDGGSWLWSKYLWFWLACFDYLGCASPRNDGIRVPP